MDSIEVYIPVRTVSELNCFQPWRTKHARHKRQKHAVQIALLPYEGKISLPCKIVYTRIAPRTLDYDNLVSSGKYLIDKVADLIIPGLRSGRADSDPRLSYEYLQEKGKVKEYAVKIKLIMDM